MLAATWLQLGPTSRKIEISSETHFFDFCGPLALLAKFPVEVHKYAGL